jgi:hypothetical protein
MASEYDDAIRRCIDEQIEIERKAAAWDELRLRVSQSQEPIAPTILDLMDKIVHPAHRSSTC